MRDEIYYLMDSAERCKKNLRDLGIPFSEGTVFVLKKRSTKSIWGKCTRRYGEFTVTIDPMLCDGKHMFGLDSTMYHELLHTCPDCWDHGKTWKHYAEIVNQNTGALVQRTDSAENKGVSREEYLAAIKPKYAYKCKGCGQMVYKTRACAFTKHPERYRCGICKSDFVMVNVEY